MATYWDFANNKPNRDMGLKADWKVQQVNAVFSDNTEFMSELYQYGPRWGSGVYATFTRKNIIEVQPQTWTIVSNLWGQAQLMPYTDGINLGARFGMRAGDFIMMTCTGGNVNNYCDGVPSSYLRFAALRNNMNGQKVLLQYMHGQGGETAYALKDEDVNYTGRYDFFVTCKFPESPVGQTIQIVKNTWRASLVLNRRKIIKVDYGSTVGELLARADLPTYWKKSSGTVQSPSKWVIQNGTYAGKTLSEVPTTYQITSSLNVEVTY